MELVPPNGKQMTVLPKLVQESVQRLSVVRWGSVDLSGSLDRPPDDENPVEEI